MVGYMSLEEQVDADFSCARRRASFRRFMARLRRDPTLAAPPCFGEVSEALGARGGGVRLGLRTVPTERIAGSVGRCSEFDEAFMPIRAGTEERWKRIDRVFYGAKEFPPVSLYKIGGSYFVLDGNHRVSVYRYHGVKWVDAYVAEFGARSGLGSAFLPTAQRAPDGTTPNEEDDGCFSPVGCSELSAGITGAVDAQPGQGV
jgi:hypothetical protein